MRLTEPKPTSKHLRPNGSRPDRLTQLLVAVAIILVALAVVIGADTWMRAPAGGDIVQALGIASNFVPPTDWPKPAESPDAQKVVEAATPDPSPVEAAAPAANTPPPCVPPDDWGLHIVEVGNTLPSVAERYSADIQTLMRVNCLNTETIFVNQRLYVPGGLAFTTLAAPLEIATFTPISTEVRRENTTPSPTSTPFYTTTALPTRTLRPSDTPTAYPTSTPRPIASATLAPTEAPVATAPNVSESATEPPARSSAPTATPLSAESSVPPTGSPAGAGIEAAAMPDPLTTSAPVEVPVVPTAYASEPRIEASVVPSLAPTVAPAPGGPAVVPTESALETGIQASVMPTPMPTATRKTAIQVNIPNRYLNIVLLGSDKGRSAGAWRTDTMIIASVDLETNVIRLLSIPRDLWVYIPGYGYNRINTAELWGELAKKGSGTERVKQTIHYNLGIPIHYYARVDFKGFMKIVDTVGGVDIDVVCPLSDIELKPGLHHMDGKNALRYARSRKSTSDFDRGRRQRKVLKALWDQALTVDMVPRLPELWVTMADAFETDLPLDQVVNLAYVGIQLKPQHILSTAIGRKQVKSWTTPRGAQVLLPREEELRTFLEGYYSPKDPAELDAVAKVRVQVLNGAERHQAEILAASALRWAGFKVADTGQADHLDYDQTLIIVYDGDSVAGEEIARRLGVPLTRIQNLSGIEDKPRPSTTADVQVILGKDYNPCHRQW